MLPPSTACRSCLAIEDKGDLSVIGFLDRRILDDHNIQRIGEELFALIDSRDRRKLLLNFENVEYLSSTALGKLIALNKKLRGVNGQLVLCGIAPSIYEVFAVTKLDKIFKILPNLDAGLGAF